MANTRLSMLELRERARGQYLKFKELLEQRSVTVGEFESLFSEVQSTLAMTFFLNHPDSLIGLEAIVELSVLQMMRGVRSDSASWKMNLSSAVLGGNLLMSWILLGSSLQLDEAVIFGVASNAQQAKTLRAVPEQQKFTTILGWIRDRRTILRQDTYALDMDDDDIAKGSPKELKGARIVVVREKDSKTYHDRCEAWFSNAVDNTFYYFTVGAFWLLLQGSKAFLARCQEPRNEDRWFSGSPGIAPYIWQVPYWLVGALFFALPLTAISFIPGALVCGLLFGLSWPARGFAKYVLDKCAGGAPDDGRSLFESETGSLDSGSSKYFAVRTGSSPSQTSSLLTDRVSDRTNSGSGFQPFPDGGGPKVPEADPPTFT